MININFYRGYLKIFNIKFVLIHQSFTDFNKCFESEYMLTNLYLI